MNRTYFDEELKSLNNEVINMGELILKSFDDTILALKDFDVDKARVVIERDDKIDEKEQEIERLCISTLSRQQPVAKDLRNVLSILKLITDLERIADNCADISEYVIKMQPLEVKLDMSKVVLMATFAKEMLQSTITAYTNLDRDLAMKTVYQDDVVDDYFEEISAEMTNLIKDNKDNVDFCVNILFIIKYLERMADHCTNVCEWISYRVTGEHDSHIG